MLKLQKHTKLLLMFNLAVFLFDLMFMWKEEKRSVPETSLNTYAFFPQMAPRYQLRQVLKYFFLVPMTCWSAQTLGLIRSKTEKEAKISWPLWNYYKLSFPKYLSLSRWLWNRLSHSKKGFWKWLSNTCHDKWYNWTAVFLFLFSLVKQLWVHVTWKRNINVQRC